MEMDIDSPSSVEVASSSRKHGLLQDGGYADEPAKKKRKKAKKAVMRPEPGNPNLVVGESITVVKCSLSSILKAKERDTENVSDLPGSKDKENEVDLEKQKKDLRCLIEELVQVVNQIAKRVSMFAKELYLSMLAAGEDTLPDLNQEFFRGLYMSACRWERRNGPAPAYESNYEDVVKRHRCRLQEFTTLSPPLVHAAMRYRARKLAAEIKTHYESHYDSFYRRWHKKVGSLKPKSKKRKKVEAKTSLEGNKKAFKPPRTTGSTAVQRR